MSAKQWPADKVERRPIAHLMAYALNPRTHTQEQIDNIAASMREWGWTNPVLIDEEGTIIAGHARVRAAHQIGFTEVPVMVARGWTDAQKRAYVIADNQLAITGAGWDEALLKVELAELQTADFDLDLLGFDDIQLVNFMSGVSEETAETAPDPPANPVTRTGDLWLLGPHRLLCGDATVEADVQKLFGREKPHLMVTDPPYGVNYDPMWREESGLNAWASPRMTGKVAQDDKFDWRDAWMLFPGDVAYVWHAGIYTKDVQISLEAAELMVRSQIIWRKPHFPISRGDYHWQHEPCWYCVRKGKTGHWHGDRKQSTVWDIMSFQVAGGHRDETKFGHGTQKPVECMRRPIANNSRPGEWVYDPFVGSGTTIIAAEMAKRRCLALDLDPVYADMAVRRWEGFAKKEAVLEGSGLTFAQVAEQRGVVAEQPGEPKPLSAAAQAAKTLRGKVMGQNIRRKKDPLGGTTAPLATTDDKRRGGAKRKIPTSEFRRAAAARARKRSKKDSSGGEPAAAMAK